MLWKHVEEPHTLPLVHRGSIHPSGPPSCFPFVGFYPCFSTLQALLSYPLTKKQKTTTAYHHVLNILCIFLFFFRSGRCTLPHHLGAPLRASAVSLPATRVAQPDADADEQRQRPRRGGRRRARGAGHGAQGGGRGRGAAAGAAASGSPAPAGTEWQTRAGILCVMHLLMLGWFRLRFAFFSRRVGVLHFLMPCVRVDVNGERPFGVAPSPPKTWGERRHMLGLVLFCFVFFFFFLRHLPGRDPHLRTELSRRVLPIYNRPRLM